MGRLFVALSPPRGGEGGVDGCHDDDESCCEEREKDHCLVEVAI